MAVLLEALGRGISLGLPMSRPMPAVAHGAHELRVSDQAGEVRVFYYTKHRDALLVFHMFRKKVQRTPEREIDTARKRLRDML